MPGYKITLVVYFSTYVCEYILISTRLPAFLWTYSLKNFELFLSPLEHGSVEKVCLSSLYVSGSRVFLLRNGRKWLLSIVPCTAYREQEETSHKYKIYAKYCILMYVCLWIRLIGIYTTDSTDVWCDFCVSSLVFVITLHRLHCICHHWNH